MVQVEVIVSAAFLPVVNPHSLLGLAPGRRGHISAGALLDVSFKARGIGLFS